MTKDEDNKPHIDHDNKVTGNDQIAGSDHNQNDNSQNDQHDNSRNVEHQGDNSFTQTPPPQYQSGGGMNQTPQYGQAATASGSYSYKQGNRGKSSWKKGLLICGIIVVVVVLLGFAINNFFNNLFSVGDEKGYEIPNSDYIARISVEGEIASTDEDGYLSSGNTYYHQFTLDAIEDLISDNNNKAILLFVNTPGGGVYESDELYLKIKKYQEETRRPVYVAMGSMAASGGYYISAPADKILANRNCWTGSIGVTLGTQYDISGFLKKNGIKTETITSGKNKAMGSYVEPMTKEQKKIFQSLVDEAYDQFVGIIAEGRDMDIATVKKIGDGRIYTAQQAQNIGLIDGIATEEETTDLLKKDNGLSECKVVNIEKAKKTSWLDEFLYSKVDPIIESFRSISKGDLGTALDLASDDDENPLKYLYEK